MSWEDAVSWLKSQPEHAELVRACFYDDPLLDAAERYSQSSEWRAIKTYLSDRGCNALDLGAGRGIASYALAKEGYTVVAVEPDASNIVGAGAIRNLATESKLNIVVEQNWAESLPFPNESFDVVHARQVLHHARDLNQLCSEACRVLKKGGLFIATREHVISSKEDLAKFQDSHSLHKLYGGENAYLLKEYLDAITKGGVKVVKVLNPYESDINLYPDTVNEARKRLAEKIKLPLFLVPKIFLKLRGALSNSPGRLYTFIGYKS